MVKIYLGKHVGFCWGVQRVLDLVKKLLENGEKVHVFGDLVHNDFVIGELEASGVIFHGEDEVWKVGELDGVAVIRAHGTPPEERERLERISRKVFDGTCPIVSRLFEIGEAMEREGYQVCVYGNPQHPEMRAFKGYVKTAAFYPEICEGRKVAILAQTTADFSKFMEYARSSMGAGKAEVRIFNTICSETLMREKEAREMAKIYDVVLVVGGKKSSNTRKLYEIARNHGTALWVEDVNDLEGYERHFQGKIGIVSGTSTPMKIVRRIANYIERGGHIK